ncbi:hypothetical protein K0M31_019682 [Melipona bicolor]|uniref:Uncharacterized protein n=1 Tax=Melipona bicolor TaxID=60889 RepID=A0AA40G2X7_9HYME|nr:hypothetical protein K0M31_019682 [Melipona bicolor]
MKIQGFDSSETRGIPCLTTRLSLLRDHCDINPRVKQGREQADLKSSRRKSGEAAKTSHGELCHVDAPC